MYQPLLLLRDRDVIECSLIVSAKITPVFAGAWDVPSSRAFSSPIVLILLVYSPNASMDVPPSKEDNQT